MNAGNNPRAALTASEFFDGPGEMRELCRAVNWELTPLGAVANWPISLRATVKTMMASRQPMFLFWGPQYVQIYNDAYRPSLGEDGRHRLALGARGAEFWTEIWPVIGPEVDQIMHGGEATWHADLLLPIYRNGHMEDVYWTYSRSPAHDDDGRVAGVLVVCQETTMQVKLRSELEVERSRLAYVFQQAPSFLAVLRGPPFVFEFVNEAYKTLIGEHRDLTGERVFDIVPETRDQGFEALLDTVVESGQPFLGREVPIQLARTPGAELESRYLDFVYFPLIEADGSRSGVIAHGNDITEQVHARREVERLLQESEGAREDADAARAEADIANRSKGEFMAMLSHELRTPLAAISGYSELLSMETHGALTKEQTLYVQRIQRSQQHVLGLIDGLLMYAQVEAGKLYYSIAPVLLSEVLATCEALTAPQMRERQLVFRISTPPEDLIVIADLEKTRQIVVNLLSNAIKFTTPGGTVSLETASDIAGRVRIVVRDSGIGIAAENLGRIFEPFVRINVPEGREQRGTGLGLAISQTFARGMGGTLTVESEPGAGSAFTLTLPGAASRAAITRPAILSASTTGTPQ
ncbi:MAG: PAS domain-containing protein [Phycisphaerae bacterium]|nr:PAS domain-containing protein [Gemmatimonadaceae bacterium]